MAEDTAVSQGMINNMPDELLVMIFSHLSFSELVDVIQKVCWRWRRVSQDARLWEDKEYHIRDSPHCNSDTCKTGKTDVEAIQIFRSVPNLRKVIVSGQLGSRAIRVLCNNCRRLSKLDLGATLLSGSELRNLVDKCSRLHKLTVSDVLLWEEKFAKPVSRLEHLRVLHVTRVNRETTNLLRLGVLRPLADGCPQLSEVDFGPLVLCMDDLSYFLNAKRNTLKSICIRWAMHKGTSLVLPLLMVCAETLERLHLRRYNVVPDLAREAFTALGSLKNLQELTMSTPHRAPPGATSLAFRTGGLPKLRRLVVKNEFYPYILGLRANSGGLEDDTVVAITYGCPALRELSLSRANKLSDAAFSHIHNLEHLEILNVSACSGLGGALIPRLATLPRLHTLLLRQTNFSELRPGLRSIVDLSNLRYLAFDYSIVVGVPFQNFPGKLHNLRKLTLTRCMGDAKATDGLTEKMPNLKIEGSIEQLNMIYDE